MPTSVPVETGDLAFDSSSTDLSSSEEDVEAASEGQTSYRSFTTYFGTQLTKALVPLHDSCFCRLLHSPSWYHKEIRRSSAAHRRALCRCGAILVLSIATSFWPWFRLGLHAMEHCDAQLASVALEHGFDATHAYQRTVLVFRVSDLSGGGFAAAVVVHVAARGGYPLLRHLWLANSLRRNPECVCLLR
eukprot:TRINITY_DN9608_c0_g1_i3.p1 TRINITY_DN9608_c0_g1~~TRINITY_DN9608_c0_g1_i3.p1  ORF type:complete len:189 (-),score=20.61 TRINITY_DN9608_c0_g1_i3:181-747(-)